MKKSSIRGAFLLSLILFIPEMGCPGLPPPNGVKMDSPKPGTTVTTTTPTPSAVNGNNTNTTPTNTEPTPPPLIPSTPGATPMPAAQVSKITFNPLTIKDGSANTTVTLKGTNFISGKLKNIAFVNEAGVIVNASLDSLTETEVVFKVPTGTDLGLTYTSSENNQKYHMPKINLVLTSGETILVDSFKVFLGSATSSSYSNGSSGGGGGFMPVTTPTPITGNVVIDFNTNPPQSDDSGMIAGVAKIAVDEGFTVKAVDTTILTDATVTVFNSSNVQIGSGTTGATGAYSINVAPGTGYYLTIAKSGYTTFKYYGIGTIAAKTITNAGDSFSTLASVGVGVISGKLKDSTSLSVIDGSILKIYDKNNRLIMTGLANSSGNYSFEVPANVSGSEFWFEIIKSGYRTFQYYGLLVGSSLTVNIEDIYQSVDTVSLTTVKGLLKDSSTQTIITNGVVRIYKNNQLIMTGLADANGVYNIIGVPVFTGIDYHFAFVRSNYTTFFYYGDATGAAIRLTANVTTTIENIFLTLASVGVGTMNGALNAATLSEISGSIIRIYNKAGLLIMTGRSGSTGSYNFLVPVGSDYYFDVIKSGYTAFRYLGGFNIVINTVFNVDKIYLTLASLGVSIVSGNIKNVDNAVIDGGIVRIYNSDGELIMTNFADANGFYNFSVPVGTNYYVRIIRTGYTDFFYYGVNLINGTPFTIENLYLTLASLGTGTVSGTVNLDGSVAGTVIRIYNSAGLLIMTRIVGADGKYNFFVPTGTGYYFRIIRSGYTDFYYYGVNVLLNQVYNLTETFYLYQSSIGTGSFSGTYIDSVTNKPVANTVVRIYDSGNNVIATGFTDINGYYFITVPTGINYYYRYYHYIGGFNYTYYYTYNRLSISNGITYYSQPVYYIAPEFQGKGTLSGSVINGITAERVVGLNLKIRAGVNERNADVVATGTTGAKGFYSFNNLDAGNYTLEVSGTGYATAYYSVTILGGRTTADQNVVVSPNLALGQTRVVLYWSSSPSDLDLHLTGPKSDSTRFHVSYDNKGTSTAEPFATLDRDTFGGYGPEVITIHNQLPGVYRFSVHDFTNQAANLTNKSFSLSYGYVRAYVYNSTGFVNSFYVPYAPNGGNLWTVFELNGSTITPVNTVSYVDSGFNIQSNRAGSGKNDAQFLKGKTFKNRR